MAEQPDVNLGSVGFSLIANTDDLERSLRVLGAFAERNNRLQASVNENTAVFTRQQIAIERSMTSLFDRMTALNERLQKMGPAASKVMGDVNQTFSRIITTATRGDMLQPQELDRLFGGAKIYLDQSARATKQLELEQEALTKQSEALGRAQVRTATLVSQLQSRRAGTDVIGQANANLKEYEATLSKGVLTSDQMVAANLRFSSSQAALGRSWREQTAVISAAQSATDQYTSKRLQQEAMLFQAQERTANVVSRMGMGITSAAPQIQQVNNALKDYSTTLQGGILNTEQLQNAEQRYVSTTAASLRTFKEQEAQARRNRTELIAQETAQTRLASSTIQLARQTQISNDLVSKAQRFGIDPNLVGAQIAALERYKAAMAPGNSYRQQIVALGGLQLAMHNTRQAMEAARQTGTNLSNFMFDLNKAVILAAGPLSGLGARVMVMKSLLDSGSASTAFFIAGIVGLGAAVAILGTKAVKVSMEMERFNALLTSSTGASALARDEFQYVVSIANQLGQSVQGLVAPYANFSTAARLAGFTVEEQRDVFEAVMTTGAALRFDTEKTQRTFLALEQMVSKGTVQMQELKLQLGQAIPGAMEIAAIAMGKTTAELNKMMESGDLLAKDFLLKLAPTLRNMFGAGALEGARTLQSEFARLSTAVFLFNEQLDEQVRVSQAVRTVVIALANALNYMSEHMSELISIVAALTSAMAALAATALVGWLLRASGSVAMFVAEMRNLSTTVAMVGWGGLLFGVRNLAAGIPGPVGLIIKLTAALAAAQFAYDQFNKKVDESTSEVDEFIKKSGEWTQTVEQIGFAHKRTYDQMISKTQQMIRVVGDQMLVNSMLLQTQLDLERQAARAEPIYERGVLKGFKSTPVKSPRILEIEEEQKALQERLGKLQELLNQYKDMTVKDINTSGKLEKDNKAWESFKNKVQDAVTTYQGLVEAAKTPLDEDAKDWAAAVAQAKKFMDDIPKKQGDILALQNLIGNATGIWADSLQEQLEFVFFAQKRLQDYNQNEVSSLKERQTAIARYAEMYKDLNEAIDAANEALAGKDPEHYKTLKARNDLLNDFQKVLAATGLTAEQVAVAMEHLSVVIKQKFALEDEVAKVKKLKDELEKIGNAGFGKIDAAWIEWAKKIKTIQDATKALGLSEGERTTYVAEANRQLYEKLWKYADSWTKKVMTLIQQLETDIASVLADITMGANVSGKDFLNKLEKDILEFGYRMMLLKPLFTNLFGDLYTGGGKNAPGMTGSFGLLGSLAGNLGINLPRLLGIAGSNTSLAADIATPGFENFVALAESGIMHGGGIVGITGAVKALPSAIWANAPRMHRGGWLGPDEVPIIAQRGERVLSREQARIQGRDIQIMVPVTIVTPNIDSFNASRAQIAGSMGDMIRSAVRSVR